MKLGTFCSGIGAPELSGIAEPIWFSEIDRFASAVLAQRFPGVPNLGDMTAADIVERIAAIGLPDVVVAGLPCQPFSVAGLRRGTEDPRNLTVRFVEIADAVDDLRHAAGQPSVWWVVENVPGLFSDKGNAFGALVGGLVGDDAALDRPRGGWTHAGVAAGPRRRAAWRVLDTQHFGLAQRRARIYLVARGGAGSWAAADALLPVVESLRWHPAPSRGERERASRPVASSPEGGSGYRLDADTADDLIPEVAGTLGSDGKAAGSATLQHAEQDLLLAFGGNDTRGPIDVATARNAHSGPSGRLDFESETFIAQATPTLEASLQRSRGAGTPVGALVPEVAHSLRADGFDASEDGTGRGTPLGPVASEPICFTCKTDAGDAGVTSPTLRAMGHGGGTYRCLACNETFDDPYASDTGGLAPAECPRCGEEVRIEKNRSHANAGGQVAVAFDTTQITHPKNRCNPHPGDPCHPLAAGAHAPALAFHARQDPDSGPVTHPLDTDGFSIGDADAWRVRRITPREAERLQGMPDDWTLIGMGRALRKAVEADMADYYRRTNQNLSEDDLRRLAADGPRYRVIGNAMSVQVVGYVLERIALVSADLGESEAA